MKLKFLIEKEFKQILRNPMLPQILIIMPIMTMLLMPWAATMEIRNVKIAIVDNDHSPLSRRLIDKLEASAYFYITSFDDTYSRAMQRIESGKADLILEIPNDFNKNIVSKGATSVLIASNAVNGMQGSLASMYMNSTVNNFAIELQVESGVAPTSVVLDIEPRYLFNPYMDSKVYMVPALMVMLMTMLCGFMPTLNIVGEKEKGTIEQMNVSPVGKIQFIVAKIIPIWCIGFIALTLCILIAWGVYGITVAGSVWTIYGAALLFAAGFAGAGLVVSTVSSTMQQSMFVMFFFMIIFILTSGLFTPVNSMPVWMQHLTVINPLKYFIEITRMVYLKGSSIVELPVQFLALGIFAFSFGLFAIIGYRKQS